MPDELPTVQVSDVAALRARDAMLLDVREDDEWAAGHIDGAVHVPMNQLPARLQADAGTVPVDRPVIVVCKAGGRSAQVTAWLDQQGYDVHNLDGGMLAWAADHQPMVADEERTPTVY